MLALRGACSLDLERSQRARKNVKASITHHGAVGERPMCKSRVQGPTTTLPRRIGRGQSSSPAGSSTADFLHRTTDRVVSKQACAQLQVVQQEDESFTSTIKWIAAVLAEPRFWYKQ